MKKIITLKLSKLKYSSKSIGDDIRIEIEVLDRFYRKNMQLQSGKSRDINEEIIRYVLDQQCFELPVVIRIIERDPFHDDVGIIEAKIKVDLDSTSPQQSTHRIKIPGAPHRINYPAQKDKVWFLIKYGDNDRFIHIGQQSKGCITLLDHKQWNKELYSVSARAREGDALHIDTVEIID